MTEGGPNMFDLKTISSLNDSHLIENFSISVKKEREILSEVVAHLSQILKRQLYAKEGYSSLFNYLREKFHYSESAAYRRIQAAKITLLYPEVLALLEEGKVNLSTLSLIESELTKENAKSIIDQIIGKSKREVEYLLAEMFSFKKSMATQDRIRRLPVLKEEGADKPLLSNGLSNNAQIYTSAAEVKREEPVEILECERGEIFSRASISYAVASRGKYISPLFYFGSQNSGEEASQG